jgi:formylglycine-generating enzyme required for sulfatase activity
LLDTSDERPPHAVSIPRFAVSKYDITFAEWQACVTFGGCRTTPNPDDQFWGRRTRPVINVAPEDAQEYVAWLSQVTGQTYRLLSEAEWEYAARGYTSLNDPHYRYPWGDAAPVCDRNAPNGAAFDHCLDRDRRTFPVGSFPPNRFGLYDMAGNVSQWVQDCYAESYSLHPADGSAFVRSFCAGRVTRGGSWESPAESLRSSMRRMEFPHLRDEVTGFRVARALWGAR